jgi:nucleotide-binding universal stress UspA family protein
VHGQPAQVLRDASASADLVLIARRRHAFPVGHLGGTARALLRESLAPVMVLPPAEE